MKTLWTDGLIFTMDAEGETVEAVLVENGKIIQTGQKDQLVQLADQVNSLQGATMYPGFVDSHIHLIGHGEKLAYLDLSTFTSIQTIVSAVTEHVKKGDWYVAEGWNDNKLVEGRPITCNDLDEMKETPVVLKRICRHVLVANSKAMELAGVTKDTPNPIGGIIGKDEHGNLNGLFYDEAQQLITSHIPAVTIEYLEEVIKASVADLQSKGLTGVHTEDMAYYGPYTVPLEAYRRTIESSFRTHLLRHHEVFEQMQGEEPTEFIEFGAMKIFIDGSLGGHTALLSEDYSDSPGVKGVAVHNQEKLENLVKLARKHDENIAVHVIGDKAVEIILDLIEKYPVPVGKKDRLIHVNVLTEELVNRMANLPVVLDIQPMFVPSDFPWVVDRLGEERLTWAYAWKTLVEKGFDCSGGSDSPIELADPLLGMDAATNNIYLPHQELTAFEAISLFTSGSAKAIGMEHIRGKIMGGYDADFTIVDQALTKQTFATSQVLQTIVNGEIVFKR
ncbi:amidohydrolase [Psychrobacillus lasiicapitis]|uniref:Amidohydrolase n=1 Tax=Psychrobacillus lasiicapitis TaxID=1636719 RepID=A0A544THG1_9BACI|nr:amidohydrolase [Psychrobacillus lasiicapitis]TQR16840.1 amidohydrolase [Psychrobacillus lasiicapitis]GGA26719.1 putative amidohydrolase YtcJ [Psychrobacillus lasiicapitis]